MTKKTKTTSAKKLTLNDLKKIKGGMPASGYPEEATSHADPEPPGGKLVKWTTAT